MSTFEIVWWSACGGFLVGSVTGMLAVARFVAKNGGLGTPVEEDNK